MDQMEAVGLHGSRPARRVKVAVGWVAASGISRRSGYAVVVEHSVYVDRAARGTGVGLLPLSRRHEPTSFIPRPAWRWTALSTVLSTRDHPVKA